MESENRMDHEASFSSYITEGKDIFVHKNFKAEEGEIRIFGAEKYFAGMNVDNEDSPRFDDNYGRKNHGCKKEKMVDITLLKSNPKPEINKVIGRKIFTGLSCNHSCYDKNSVQIDRNHAKLNQFQPNCGKARLQKSSVDRQVNEEEQRKAVDLLSSQTVRNRDITLYLERKLSMLKWDAIPNPDSIPTSSKDGGMYEDLESDASSDLFEIENLSGSEQQPVPKKADVSAISGFEEKKEAENVVKTTFSKSKSTNGKTKHSSLLGCKSDKAVSVVEAVAVAKRRNGKAKTETRQRQKLGAAISSMRLQAETKMKNISFS